MIIYSSIQMVCAAPMDILTETTTNNSENAKNYFTKNTKNAISDRQLRNYRNSRPVTLNYRNFRFLNYRNIRSGNFGRAPATLGISGFCDWCGQNAHPATLGGSPGNFGNNSPEVRQ